MARGGKDERYFSFEMVAILPQVESVEVMISAEPVEKAQLANYSNFRTVKFQQLISHRKSQNIRI